MSVCAGAHLSRPVPLPRVSLRSHLELEGKVLVGAELDVSLFPPAACLGLSL